MSKEKPRSPFPPSVTWRRTGEEAVILNLDTSEYYSANEAGAFIWERLAAGASSGAIAGELAEEYGLPPSRAAADVEDFLGELAGLRLLGPKAGK